MQFFRGLKILESKCAGTGRVLIASEHTEGMRSLTSALRRIASLSTIVSPFALCLPDRRPAYGSIHRYPSPSFLPAETSSHDVANRSSIL
jgi:hypothetical protein